MKETCESCEDFYQILNNLVEAITERVERADLPMVEAILALDHYEAKLIEAERAKVAG